MSMSGPPPPWHMLRSYRRDRSVAATKLAPGTVRRIARFARPYRSELGVFLLAVTISALIGVATPVLAGRVINPIASAGGRHGSAAVVVRLAVIIAVLAVLDAVLSLAQRWYSSRIGEGMIYSTCAPRCSTTCSGCRWPFFTRTQTGALVSRLNNDVIGAQQAFTSTLSGVVVNVIELVLTAAVMFSLSWQITALSLVLLPVFVLPARRVGTPAAGDHPRVVPARTRR